MLAIGSVKLSKAHNQLTIDKQLKQGRECETNFAISCDSSKDCGGVW